MKDERKINKVAVIGSGVMGAGIAAIIANSGIPVLLYDIPYEEGDKLSNYYANMAINGLIKSVPNNLILRERAELITPLNLKDDLEIINQADWIIEVIIENLEAKRDLYSKINDYKKKNAIISSNTSTIPLSKLTEGQSESFKNNFLITHFFNPPRHLKLLEIVYNKDFPKHNLELITNFLEDVLGRIIVNCKDTPGFIANRIGCFFLEYGIRSAIKNKIPIEKADFLTQSLGLPKTGIFGLYDLIGLDVMDLISQQITNLLPPEDLYVKTVLQPESILNFLISNNYKGRKSGSGFYRFITHQDKKIKQVFDWENKNYIDVLELKDKISLQDIIKSQNNDDKFISDLLSNLICYCSSLVGEISDNIYDIDKAIKKGYNWKYGPFELADFVIESLGSKENFFKLLREYSKYPINGILAEFEASSKERFYISKAGIVSFFVKNKYFSCKEITGLGSILNEKDLIKTNKSSSLYDFKDKTAILTLDNKMGVLDEDVFEMILYATKYLPKNKYKGIIITGRGENFCAGANLEKLYEYIKNGDINKIDNFLKMGQQAMLALKYSFIPVIAAVNGYALGGGCELFLHCSKSVVNLDSYLGLVEFKVGLIPSWGGVKEIFLNCDSYSKLNENLTRLVNAQKSGSAAEFRQWGLVPIKDMEIIYNPNKLLQKAKELLLSSYKDYRPRYYKPFYNMLNKLDINLITSNIDGHSKFIFNELYNKITGFSVASEDDLLKIERDLFLDLIQTEDTKLRIEKILKK